MAPTVSARSVSTRRILASVIAASALMGGAAGATAAPTADDTKPSWSQFKQQTAQDPNGQYIVDGDIPVATTSELKTFYNQLLPKVNKAPKTGTGDLIANKDSYGNVTLWSASQARSLTYCVSDKFGSRKSAVVNAMSGGTNLWENASSGVNFSYIPSQDSNCTTRNNNVTFSVEPVVTSDYIARAFFPNSPKSGRNILVAQSLTTSGWSPSNILGHELGHVLGFRHEHTRPEAGTCFEDNNWVPLTPYDSVSIMHYPQCNGDSQDLSFSSLDTQGVKKAYGD